VGNHRKPGGRREERFDRAIERRGFDMKKLAQRTLNVLGAAVLALAFSTALAVSAQAGGKSIQTEAEWIKFDPAAKTVTVKVKKPGRGPEAKRLTRNKEAVFLVKPEGSVLTRTTVTIDSKKAELTDITAGRTVNVYWRPDEEDESAMFARKIDVILSDEELDAKYREE
jgi:hypothetical protein